MICTDDRLERATGRGKKGVDRVVCHLAAGGKGGGRRTRQEQVENEMRLQFITNFSTAPAL
jgi:hypothetical protein